MTLAEFYAAILPRGGSTCLFTLGNKQHVWAKDITQLVRATEMRHGAQGTYFATAAFIEPTQRTQANVLALRALRLDIDAGEAKHAKNPEGTYPTQRDALAALIAFSKAAQLAPSFIVSSGEGLHIYYALDADLGPAQWSPLAKRLAALCVEHGFKADPSVTTDTARVLRPIGSLHPNGKRVALLKATGKVYAAAELVALLGVAPEPEDEFGFDAAGRTFDLKVNAEVAVEGPPKSILPIVAGCGAMREAAAAQGDIPEPFWRAMLGIVKFTVEGLDMAHEMSRGHEGYDPDSTEAKFNAYAAGPPTCGEFAKHSTACQACPHAGKIKSPITLGRLNDVQVAELPAELQPKEPEAPKPTGMPWDGCLPPRFSVVGVKGAYTLQYTMKVTKEDADGIAISSNVIVPVTNDIFWLANWSEAADSKDTGQVEVKAYIGGAVRSYLMDQSYAAGKFDLLKWLAGKTIHLSTDKKAGQAVEDYVKLSLARIKALAKRPKISGRFGLQITPEGKLICAQGAHVIFGDGTIQEAMLAEGLVGRAVSYTVPLPPSHSGEWQKEVWADHILPLARQYTEFMAKHYGAPGLGKYQLVAMLGLASPFMAFVTGGYSEGLSLPKNGLSVSLYSRKSEQGKTALVRAIMMAYGRPDELVSDSNENGSTDKGRMGRLSTSGSFPTSMDEMGNTKESSITAMISSVANGGGRTLGDVKGGSFSVPSWALINLITTNRSQRDMVAVGQKESAAIQQRLFELDVDDIVFDNADRNAYKDALAVVEKNCKGALGAVINYYACKLGPTYLNKALLASVARADTLLSAEQGARFQSRALGAALFLQRLLEQTGLKMFDEATLIDEFKKGYASGVTFVAENILPSDGPSLMATMLSDLKAHTLITETETNRAVDKVKFDLALNARMPDDVLARHITTLGWTYVSCAAVREWCTKNKISERDMMAECRGAGIVIPPANTGAHQVDLFKGMAEANATRTRCHKINTRLLRSSTGGDGLDAQGASATVIEFPGRPADPEPVDPAAEAGC